MAICDTCGNDYDKAFSIHMNGSEHIFDCFECAIQALAPPCSACGTRVIGHGVEAQERFFCSAHCANSAGTSGIADRA